MAPLALHKHPERDLFSARGAASIIAWGSAQGKRTRQTAMGLDRQRQSRPTNVSSSGFVRLLRGSSGSECKLALPDKHQIADVNDGVRQISENADGIPPEKK